MVQIVTDSSVLYTREEAKKAGFEVMPLCINIGDLEDRDMEVDMDEFYGRIKKGEHPRSSQPPIGEVMDIYEKYAGDEVINIEMADGLSGTYQSACGAKNMVENGENVTVINSTTLCGPHRYMVEKAQQMKEAGCSAKEIIDWVKAATKKHESFLIPQDFDFLRRGGRLTPMAAALGSVLRLKPIMTQTPDGKQLDKYGVKRTMKAAFATVIEHMKKRAIDSKYVIYVSHARAKEDAQKAIAMLKEAFGEVDIRMLDLGAAFVTQGGPQCVAIQYIEK